MYVRKCSFIFFLILFSSFGISAAEYPSRPIEMVVPFDPGSGIDIVGRLLAELSQEHLGGKFLITNKSGGAGATGYTYIKNSKPDGYLIGLVNNTIASHKVYGNLPFDHHDLSVIAAIYASPTVVCVPSDSKYQKLEDIIQDARERPGEIRWASTSGVSLISSEEFFNHSNLKFKVIPSGGGPVEPVIQALGGHVDIAFTNIINAKPQIEAGLLRPIVVYSKQRIKELPDTPTFEEYGVPVRCQVTRFIVAPPGVPHEKLSILNAAFQKAIASSRYQDFVAESGGTVLNAAFEDAVAMLDEQKKAFEEVAKQRE